MDRIAKGFLEMTKQRELAVEGYGEADKRKDGVVLYYLEVCGECGETESVPEEVTWLGRKIVCSDHTFIGEGEGYYNILSTNKTVIEFMDREKPSKVIRGEWE